MLCGSHWLYYDYVQNKTKYMSKSDIDLMLVPLSWSREANEDITPARKQGIQVGQLVRL